MGYDRSLYVKLGGLLTGLGALILLGFVFAGWAPLFVILAGPVLFAGIALLGKRASALAVPACVLTATGLILFYQKVTGNYQSWEYCWALLLAAAGAGLAIYGCWSGRQRILRYGMRATGTGAFLFLLAGTFVELVRGSGDSTPDSIASVLWPLALIAAAAVLMLGRSLQVSYPPSQTADPQTVCTAYPVVEERRDQLSSR